jgi:SAM-dependent methyltransferase
VANVVRGADFARVDAAPAPHALVATLDAVAAREGIRRLKQRGLDMLELSAGQRLLDVGSGTGDDVRVLAGMLAGTGLVVGVEPSAVLLVEARRRAGDSALRSGFVGGDARHLPFLTGSFDGCRAERVLQHLRDPARALAEMRRVTRPGGRIVVLDTDWGTTTVNGGDQRLTRRILDGFCAHLAQAGIGRRLPGLLHRAGMTEVDVAAETAWSRQLSAATRRPCPQLAAGAVDEGAVTPAEADRWLAQLRRAAEDGTFLWATTGFAVAGRTPSGSS